MNFLNAFVGAMTRQIGRDSGRALSNSVFGSRHATRYQRVGDYGGRGRNQQQPQQQLPQPNRREGITANSILGKFKLAAREATNLNYAENQVQSFYSTLREFNEDGVIDIYEAKVLVNTAIELKHRLVEFKKKMEEQKNLMTVNQEMRKLDDFITSLKSNLSNETSQDANVLRQSIERYESGANY